MAARDGRQVAVSLFAAALLLSACAGGTESVAGTDPVGVTATATAVAPAEGPVDEAERLLTFTGSTIDGDQFDGAGLVGRDVAIWFWAPW